MAHPNRTINRNLVDRYAREMAADNWRVTARPSSLEPWAGKLYNRNKQGLTLDQIEAIGYDSSVGWLKRTVERTTDDTFSRNPAHSIREA